jgi:5-methylcytosine-specific restriction endonuclease McrA
MICSICPRDVPTLLDGLYCSFRCRSIGRKPKKAKKPPATGSRERKKRIRAMEKNYTAEDWQKALEYFGNKCAYCGSGGRMQQEHYLPVDMGGTYTPDNIIPACGKCNSQKQRKDPMEWLLTKREHGIVTMLRISQYFATIPLDDTQKPYDERIAPCPA